MPAAVTDLLVDRVSKRYRVTESREPGANAGSVLRSALGRLHARSAEFWALQNVSFDVKRGETLGIIGNNGAGKSTILKLLSNVTSPTSGRIVVRGRMSALIEVGSGFHPELTGRENVYLSGSILGMRRREITDKLERIIDFAGVREFIDTPVKRYSSGMYLRLGFSIAAHLEPDILLLDEVLAVGDADFQAKCLDRVNELHRDGRTIVFISHDLNAVERLCRRVVLLRKGAIVADGPARDVIFMYQEMNRARTPTEASVAWDPALSREASITGIECLDEHGEPTTVRHTGDAATFRIHYQVDAPIAEARFELYLFTMLEGHFGPWCQLVTSAPGRDGVPLPVGPGTMEFTVDELGLQPGICHVSCLIAHRDDPPGRGIAWRGEGLTLRVDQGRPTKGSFYLPHRWRAVPEAAASPATLAVRHANERPPLGGTS
jgi:ABC-type polysaccharide/polyol phosphate transport system ATPase subunit